jgi:hypothetical protein
MIDSVINGLVNYNLSILFDILLTNDHRIYCDMYGLSQIVFDLDVIRKATVPTCKIIQAFIDSISAIGY